MRLNAPMTLGLGGARRVNDPAEALLQTADHYWNADDWSGSGTWGARTGGLAATPTNATKVAVGGTYNTDKTADRPLIWLNGTTAYIDLPQGAAPSFADAASHTVLIVAKAHANTASFAEVFVCRTLTGNLPGEYIGFNGTAASLLAEIDKGASSVQTAAAAITYNSWETLGLVLTASQLKLHTSTLGSFRTVSRSTGFEVPVSPTFRIGRNHSTRYQALAVSKVAIWKTSERTLEQIQAAGA